MSKGGVKVIIKGIPGEKLSSISEEEVVEQCNGLHCTKKTRGGSGTILCNVPSLERARELTVRGIKLGGQTYRCEPFCDRGRALQCFNCMKWGHIARQCHNEGRCAGCAKAKHAGECRVVKCVNCKGDHSAIARADCPVAREHWRATNKTFRDRPRTFPRPATPTTTAMTKPPPETQKTIPASEEEDSFVDAVETIQETTVTITSPTTTLAITPATTPTPVTAPVTTPTECPSAPPSVSPTTSSTIAPVRTANSSKGQQSDFAEARRTEAHGQSSSRAREDEVRRS